MWISNLKIIIFILLKCYKTRWTCLNDFLERVFYLNLSKNWFIHALKKGHLDWKILYRDISSYFLWKKIINLFYMWLYWTREFWLPPKESNNNILQRWYEDICVLFLSIASRAITLGVGWAWERLIRMIIKN